MRHRKDGIMVILSSPSGAGKTTLVKLLSEKKNFFVSISHTTRKPRSNEKNGKDYFFVNDEEFKRLIKNDVLVLEIDKKGILLAKSFYNKNDMNKIDFDRNITGVNYSKRSFIYNFLSSVRQKIDDPLGKKRTKK